MFELHGDFLFTCTQLKPTVFIHLLSSELHAIFFRNQISFLQIVKPDHIKIVLENTTICGSPTFLNTRDAICQGQKSTCSRAILSVCPLTIFDVFARGSWFHKDVNTAVPGDRSSHFFRRINHRDAVKNRRKAESTTATVTRKVNFHATILCYRGGFYPRRQLV